MKKIFAACIVSGMRNLIYETSVSYDTTLSMLSLIRFGYV